MLGRPKEPQVTGLESALRARRMDGKKKDSSKKKKTPQSDATRHKKQKKFYGGTLEIFYGKKKRVSPGLGSERIEGP